MTTLIPYLIAIVSTTAFILLWFWVVRKELYEKQSMVEAARRQLAASKEQCSRVMDLGCQEGRQTIEILKRSQSIYRQATEIYNKSIYSPWNAVPALLLGFRKKNIDI